MDHRFSTHNSQLASELVALNSESDTFLDVKHHVKHIMDLPGSPIIDDHPQPVEGDWTIHQILSKYHTRLIAMPNVLTAFKHALTFSTSTAMCEISFSTLINVFSDHRRAVLHKQKAHLV